MYETHLGRRAGLANIKGQVRTLQAVENLVTGVVHQLGGVVWGCALSWRVC
jgi:hypothetical protein